MFNSTERSVITSCSLGLPSPPCSTPWKQPGAEGANDEASSLPIPRQSTELLREATQQPHEKYATRQLSTKQAVTPHVRFLVLIAATFGLFNAPRLSRTRWCANTCLAYTSCHHQHHHAAGGQEPYSSCPVPHSAPHEQGAHARKAVVTDSSPPSHPAVPTPPSPAPGG